MRMPSIAAEVNRNVSRVMANSFAKTSIMGIRIARIPAQPTLTLRMRDLKKLLDEGIGDTKV